MMPMHSDMCSGKVEENGSVFRFNFYDHVFSQLRKIADRNGFVRYYNDENGLYRLCGKLYHLTKPEIKKVLVDLKFLGLIRKISNKGVYLNNDF